MNLLVKTSLKSGLGLSVLAAALGGLSWGSSAAAGPAYVVRSSLSARAVTSEGYWKGADKAFDHWSWMPEVRAQVLGPLPAGANVVADFSRPNGQPWTSLEMRTYDRSLPPLETGEAADLKTMVPTEAQEKLALNEGGNINFQIRSVANGASQVLFKGRMKVVKAHSGIPGANFANQFLFYNDYDWLANMGYLSQDTERDREAPPVEVHSWLHGAEQGGGKIKGYLFYQGKQIGSTDNTMQGAANDVMSITPSINIRDKDDQLDWRMWTFTFSRVLSFYSQNHNNPPSEGTFVMAQHPGDYEFKVLRNGQLVRTATFSVDDKGYWKQSGFLEYHYVIQSGMNKVGQDKAQTWMFLPMKAQGTQDGAINANAWKTDGFWGNPG